MSVQPYQVLPVGLSKHAPPTVTIFLMRFASGCLAAHVIMQSHFGFKTSPNNMPNNK